MFVNSVDVVGDEALTNSIIDRSITEIADNLVTSIGGSAFYYCTKLTTANFPVATSIGGSAFYYCTELTTANFPVATSIGGSAFRSCTKLTTANFPVATSIGGSAFRNCINLTTADFPAATSIGTYAFFDCTKLTTLILRNTEQVCSLGSSALVGTPIASGTGYIYVPRALLSDTDSTMDYRRATNWSTFATQFRALEDYTVDGTTTGALDETKI